MHHGERGDGAKFPPGTSFFLTNCESLPPGLRLDPYVSKDASDTFRIVVVNETKQTISLPSNTSLGQIMFVKIDSSRIASVVEKQEIDPNIFKDAVSNVAEDLRDELVELLASHQGSFAFKTSELGHTDLVKHSIDSQGQGPTRQFAYRFFRERYFAWRISNTGHLSPMT